MIIQSQLNHDSMRVVTHGGVLGARAPRDFRVRGNDLRGLEVNVSVSQNHEKDDFPFVKIYFKLICDDLE